jgi:predicted AAA+ superfamily ATPase
MGNGKIQGMVPRIFTELLREKLSRFPVVTILGPRQSGKTTFIKAVLSDWTYVDCERPSDAIPLEEDPEARLRQLHTNFILDEAQRIPQMFPVIRSYVDEHREKNGRMVILGSVSPRLIKKISESLAGRTSFLELSPFRFVELSQTESSFSPTKLWFRGGFPDAYLAQNDKALFDWFDSYTRTFIERDLTSMGIDVSQRNMRRLWTMISHVNGGLWNASQLASSLGVNYQTANRYVDILENAFLVRRLQPYFANIGKRLVKSPKIYFRDTGLLHYFLGIFNASRLHTHPMRGSSWEAFIIDQIISELAILRPEVRFYYWRTAAGAEVDLIIETSRGLMPVEIKLHSAPTRSMVRGLLSCMADLNIDKGYVIYPGREIYSLGKGITALPAYGLLGSLEALESFCSHEFLKPQERFTRNTGNN